MWLPQNRWYSCRYHLKGSITVSAISSQGLSRSGHRIRAEIMYLKSRLTVHPPQLTLQTCDLTSPLAAPFTNCYWFLWSDSESGISNQTRLRLWWASTEQTDSEQWRVWARSGGGYSESSVALYGWYRYVMILQRRHPYCTVAVSDIACKIGSSRRHLRHMQQSRNAATTCKIRREDAVAIAIAFCMLSGSSGRGRFAPPQWTYEPRHDCHARLGQASWQAGTQDGRITVH